MHCRRGVVNALVESLGTLTIGQTLSYNDAFNFVKSILVGPGSSRRRDRGIEKTVMTLFKELKVNNLLLSAGDGFTVTDAWDIDQVRTVVKKWTDNNNFDPHGCLMPGTL
jgi:hypothetical protein